MQVEEFLEPEIEEMKFALIALKELRKLHRKYSEGKVEIDDIINLIESSRYLKRAFVKFVIELVKDELEYFRILDYVDGYGYFCAYRKRLNNLIEDFCKTMQLRGHELIF